MAHSPLYRRLGGSVWTGVEKLALTGIQSTECANPNDLPSRLSCPGPKLILNLLDTVFVTLSCYGLLQFLIVCEHYCNKIVYFSKKFVSHVSIYSFSDWQYLSII